MTCDRAGLLVSQDIQICHRVEMKLIGGNNMEHMSLEEFILQAEEYEAQDDIIDSIFKIANNWNKRRTPTLSRVCGELQRWHDEGNYRDILEGRYTTREEEKTPAIYSPMEGKPRRSPRRRTASW